MSLSKPNEQGSQTIEKPKENPSGGPKIVGPNEVLAALPKSNVGAAPPPIEVSSKAVQAQGGAGGIFVSQTLTGTQLAGVKLAYFVGSIIAFVIVMVFVDFLFRTPSISDSLINNQTAQQGTTAKSLRSPQETPATEAALLREAVLLETPAAQGKTTEPPPTEKPTKEEPVVKAAPKTPAENYAILSNAVADRSSKMFDLVVTRALLPVFTSILGYIFGAQPRTNP
jgi:hypothetical protein